MKKIIIIMVLLMALSSFTGCSNSKYNAQIYSTTNDWVSTSFLENNKVGGVCYENPNYVEGVDDPASKYYCDESSPVSRTFIITDQETFDSIFQRDKVEVDFSKDVVYLYIFADTSPSNREYIIDDISVENQKTTIYFKLNKNDKKDGVSPYQRCLIVIMDITDTSDVEFVKQK